MFTVAAEEELPYFIGGEAWNFVGCASFEARWCGFADLAIAIIQKPAGALIVYPKDTGSAYQQECAEAQAENWKTSRVQSEWAGRSLPVELLGPAPWRIIRDALDNFVRDHPTVRRWIIDVTTMPRVCIFPAVDWALRNSAIDDLALIYTEPGSYSSSMLHSEPTGPFIVPPFDYLPSVTAGRLNVAWIPILGFGPTFAKSIYESIAGGYELGQSIYPIVGFPAFDPAFFERCLAECAPVFEGSGILNGQFIYASAADPFETRDAILRLMRSAPEGQAWIGSPMGPKPMTIGMVLAAIDRELTIIIDQARTYNPKYSTGTGAVHMYVLRQAGRRTY